MLRRIRKVADDELRGLLEELSDDKRERVLDAFSAQFYAASTECSNCLGKTYRGVGSCGQCGGTGRESLAFAVVELMRQVYHLERQRDKRQQAGDVAVAPI
jgi:recombinational DNA repair protein RecR